MSEIEDREALTTVLALCRNDKISEVVDAIYTSDWFARITATPTREQLGKVIWDTSRADEGTISATGANIIADAILELLTAEWP